jgi:Sec7-like guanine-nucleotide exchange factor
MKKSSEKQTEKWSTTKQWKTEEQQVDVVGSVSQTPIAGSGSQTPQTPMAAGPTPTNTPNKKRAGNQTTPSAPTKVLKTGTASEPASSKKPEKVGKDGKQKASNPCAAAEKSKNNYNSVLTQANTTLGCIRKNAGWSQFRGQGGEDDLQSVVDELAKVVSKEEFFEKYLICQKSLKKNMDANEFEKGCVSFSVALDPAVSAVQKVSKKLTRQFQAGLDADKE